MLEFRQKADGVMQGDADGKQRLFSYPQSESCWNLGVTIVRPMLTIV
jgi:hypothetical protein